MEWCWLCGADISDNVHGHFDEGLCQQFGSDLAVQRGLVHSGAVSGLVLIWMVAPKCFCSCGSEDVRGLVGDMLGDLYDSDDWGAGILSTCGERTKKVLTFLCECASFGARARACMHRTLLIPFTLFKNNPAGCTPFNLVALPIALFFAVAVHVLYAFVCLPLALLCAAWVWAGRRCGRNWQARSALYFLVALRTGAWFLLLFCSLLAVLPLLLDIIVAWVAKMCCGCFKRTEHPVKGPLGYVFFGHLAVWLIIFGAAPPWGAPPRGRGTW